MMQQTVAIGTYFNHNRLHRVITDVQPYTYFLAEGHVPSRASVFETSSLIKSK
ncbi:hypothetical protein BMS3Bbin04_00508 [bacterium BMS3Bbin04]|nr:hypothetical protein BMS3Bbin04_00508 [bacterium BMS3Bbin04]